ncbi:MAG: mechanosensitive ion channel family protein [Actinomycetota bacterium]
MIGTVASISLTEAIRIDSGITPWDYLTAVIVLFSAVVLGQIGRALSRRIVDRSRADNLIGDLIGRLLNYLVLTFGLIYALDILGIAIGPILGALGIAGIAVAFAFQDILENFVAGIILQIQRPFNSGDEIVTADHEGTVTAIDTRTITMATPDGETVRIPSAEVLKNPIINHTQHGKRRTTLTVGVDYASDLDLVTEVAMAALAEIDDVLRWPAPEVLVGNFGASSIDIAIRYWHEPSIDDEWSARDLAARGIAKAFRENGISIPFPQRVLHLPSTTNGSAAIFTGDDTDQPAD